MAYRNNYRERKKRFKIPIGEYAKSIRRRKIPSEEWFKRMYEKKNIALPESLFPGVFSDKYNRPFMGTYIPDVQNNFFKYIIEIDGQGHGGAKDSLKNLFYAQNGYSIIRIKSYDSASFWEAMREIVRVRRSCDSSLLSKEQKKFIFGAGF